MCGIYGYSELTPVTRAMAPLLAFAMEERGMDSWGASDGEHVIKKVGPISRSWELPEWPAAIFHTRGASVGKVSVENAHPFEFTGGGGHVIGIHNGHVANHEELNRKYGRGLEVDSMHIYANLAEGKPTSEIMGWGALAWWQDGDLHLGRFNCDALHVTMLTTGELVFASTFGPIQRAAWMAGSGVKWELVVQTERLYTVRHNANGWVLMEGAALPFGRRQFRQEAIDWRAMGVEGFFGQDAAEPPLPTVTSDLCYRCGRVKVDLRTAAFCAGCYKTLLTAWNLDSNGFGGACVGVN